MNKNEMDDYAQSLLERIASMTQEIDNLRTAYIKVNERLSKLSLHAELTIKELMEEATRVKEFAELGVEATKLTEESALITNNTNLIEAARKSSLAAQAVHQLTIDLIDVKLPNLHPIKELIGNNY